MSTFLPDETHISQVRLRTGDLQRALAFYTGTLGLDLIERTEQTATFSATGNSLPMVLLHEESVAIPRPVGTIGLFHFAIRFPKRRDLANALKRLLQFKHPIQGASDHGVSEAIYLSDPDGNGIELYVDRPRSQWVWQDGQVFMKTEPLDLDDLLRAAERQIAAPPVPAETKLGHIHLCVADLGEAEKFYQEFLGLAVTQRSYPGALFFSAGGYHHHLAANTWGGSRRPPPNSIGLVSYRLAVPEREILYCLRNRAPLAGYEARTATGEEGLLQIRDPNGHWLEVEHAPSLSQTSTQTQNSLNF